MDRRKFLRVTLSSRTTAVVTPTLGGRLDTYSGPWTKVQASHLLRRTVFGVRSEEIDRSVSLGLEGTLDLILNDSQSLDPPVNTQFALDPDVPIGKTWVDAPYSIALRQSPYRRVSMLAWITRQMVKPTMSLRAKMNLFWHNHFPITDIQDARYQYRYYDTIDRNHLGNFKQLVKDITIDPAMLRYLNGNDNQVNSPNENYARELLELFTIGKGPQVGPGDYTNYTEDDIIEIAKILTGWRDYGYRNSAFPDFGSTFVRVRHDSTIKQLSNRLGSATIGNEGENEYSTLIDVIFEQDEVSRYIARKLYRWLVYYKIDDNVEASIIEPMAEIIRDNDYEIRPAVRALLSSDFFYQEDRRGCQIKNPYDFLVGMFRQHDVPFPDTAAKEEDVDIAIARYAGILQMSYFNAPSVAGWKAYYQEPGYYQMWINSVTMQLRKGVSDLLASNSIRVKGNDLFINTLEAVSQIEDPGTLDNVINHYVNLLFAKGVSEVQMETLREVILQGLPDFEWTVEWGMYAANPEDEELAKAVDQKLRLLILYMMRMPEFQLA